MRRVTPVRLHRRALLRGVGGVALALPLLECMLDRNGTRVAGAQSTGAQSTGAQSNGLPQRYGIVFAGQALGGDGFPKDQQRIRGEVYTEAGHFIVPPELGAGYTITTPLQPLASLVDDFTLLSNLAIPYDRNSAEPDAVPPGGAYRDFHGGGCSPLISGVRSTSPEFRAGGVTSDQVVAGLHRGQTLFDSLVLRAQPSWYLDGSSFSGRQYISYDDNAERIEAQVSPQIAFESLFSGFSPDDSAAAAALDFRKRARKSILDLIDGKRDRVLSGLSQRDRQRVERHYDELRDLEVRLDSAVDLSAGECQLPTSPGDDPAIGGDNAGAGSDSLQTSTGYSEEGARTRALMDLVHMALVCDLTRSFTLQITVFQSHMNVYPITAEMGLPILADLHEVGHNGDVDNKGQLAVSTCLAWHIGHYAYFLDKLKNTPEGDTTLLDNSAVFFMPEAGHGTQLNDATTENQTHSVEQMVLLLAGRAGGLTPRGHFDGAGYHPANALVSGMQAVGYEGDALGEVSGGIPELFG